MVPERIGETPCRMKERSSFDEVGKERRQGGDSKELERSAQAGFFVGVAHGVADGGRCGDWLAVTVWTMVLNAVVAASPRGGRSQFQIDTLKTA